VQWISIPLQIGDPIPWRHLASDVGKNYRPIASTPPAKFHPNPSKFPRFMTENVLPYRYNNRRIADNEIAKIYIDNVK